MDSYIVDFGCLDDVEIGETPLAPVKHVANGMWGNIRRLMIAASNTPTLLFFIASFFQAVGSATGHTATQKKKTITQ